jgi:outer membrane protein TolC
MHRAVAALTLAGCLFASATTAQTLTMSGAIDAALAAHPDLAAAAASEAEAREHRTAAQAGWFPRVDLQEGWQRGNQPVFVFSSLLAQRHFTEADFALQALNHPDPISNHRLALVVRQPLFDGGTTGARVSAAETAGALASAARRDRAAAIAVEVAQVYAQALVADARRRAAQSAIDSATEDLARVRAKRDVGDATDADVLALDMHVAEVRARHIAAEGEARTARATLNHLMHVDLDRQWDLVLPPPASPPPESAAAPDAAAVLARADVAAAALRVDAAVAASTAARAAVVPRLSFEGGYEWNGSSWASRAASWTAGIRADWSWSVGGAEAANIRAAGFALDRARAERASVESAARLDVVTAQARASAARARQAVGELALAHARERARILRDRYDAGLAGVTDLLGAADALLDAESLDASIRGEIAVAAVLLDRAFGRVPEPQP